MSAAGIATVDVPIATDADVVLARMEGRVLGERLGLSATDLTLVATAISEVARNIVQHAGQGVLRMALVDEEDGTALCVYAEDDGPGIEDVELAMQDGFSTGGGLGLGLPGARRLMDEFDIESAPGRGTTIRMRKRGRP